MPYGDFLDLEPNEESSYMVLLNNDNYEDFKGEILEIGEKLGYPSEMNCPRYNKKFDPRQGNHSCPNCGFIPFAEIQK